MNVTRWTETGTRWYLRYFGMGRILFSRFLDAKYYWMGYCFFWHWKHITLWQGNISQFNESFTYLMGWLRSGIKFGLFYFASYQNLLVFFSLFIIVLYLGGWNLSIAYKFIPKFFHINKAVKIFGTIIGILITLAKTYLFLFIPITTRWTLPRLQMDPLLSLGWKFLLPIPLCNLLLTISFQLLSL